jgi:hypothetical protein
MAVTLNASTSSGFIQTADTSGDLALQSNGTTQFNVSSTGAYGQIKSGTAVASTSGTSIDFTSIPSWVKRITVMFQGVSTSGTSDPQIQLGTSSGVATTGYLGSSTSIAGTSAASSNYTTGIALRAGGASPAASVRHGGVTISNVTGNTWMGFGIVGYSDSATTVNTGASITLGGTLDRVRITTVNGTDTFDAGTINILYEG